VGGEIHYYLNVIPSAIHMTWNSWN